MPHQLKLGFFLGIPVARRGARPVRRSPGLLCPGAGAAPTASPPPPSSPRRPWSGTPAGWRRRGSARRRQPRQTRGTAGGSGTAGGNSRVQLGLHPALSHAQLRCTAHRAGPGAAQLSSCELNPPSAIFSKTIQFSAHTHGPSFTAESSEPAGQSKSFFPYIFFRYFSSSLHDSIPHINFPHWYQFPLPTHLLTPLSLLPLLSLAK